MQRRERAYAPSAPKVGLEEAPHDAFGAIRTQQPCPETMANVRSKGFDWLFVRVQPERIETHVFAPECLFETLPEPCGDRPLLRGAIRFVERVEYLGHPEAGVECIPL